MKNKTVGKLILITLGATLLIAIFETNMSATTSDNLYMLCGFSIFTFGIWGAIKLIKSDR